MRASPGQWVLSPSRRVVGGSRTRDCRIKYPVLCPVELPRSDLAPVFIPSTEHTRPIVVRRGGGAAGLTRSAACLKRDAGGSRTHFRPGCNRPPGRLAPASLNVVGKTGTGSEVFRGACPRFSNDKRTCPRQESNLVRDVRSVACDSSTPRGRIERNPRSGRGGIRTLTPQKEAHWLATRPGQPYPDPFHRCESWPASGKWGLAPSLRDACPHFSNAGQWTAGESNPVFRFAGPASSRSTSSPTSFQRTRKSSRQDSNLRYPVCKTGVLAARRRDE